MPYRPRTPKIYYATGVISLILLPLFCLRHLQDQKAFEELRVIHKRSQNPSLPGRADKCPDLWSAGITLRWSGFSDILEAYPEKGKHLNFQ